MSQLEIRSRGGAVLATTEKHDDVTAWVASGDLREADLAGADLREANLREANLAEADLREADLREAELAEADLAGANLRGANLAEAQVVIDGGQNPRGYRVTGWLRAGQLMLKAGCRNFTLAEARAHWGAADYLDDHDAATQDEMLARVDMIVAVARARGWQFVEE